MTILTEELLKRVMDDIEQISYVRYEDIPNIDLYMDQVTTFMDEKLQATTRNPGKDKIFTKTMINNYAKNDLLPPPVKKKYSRDHMMILTMIYFLKGVLSLQDIQELLKPITDRYFDSDDSFNLENIYKEVFNIEELQKNAIKEDITGKAERAKNMFQDAPQEEQEFFELFSLVAQLGFDVYVKRLLIEKLLDGYRAGHTQQPACKSKKKEPKTE